MNNDNDTVVRNGRTFQYDADFDVYRPVNTEPLSLWEQWGWIVVLAVMLVVSIGMMLNE